MDPDDCGHPEPSAMTWTATRLLAAPGPAYGSASFGDKTADEQITVGTVYALPRRRIVLDWRRACADDGAH